MKSNDKLAEAIREKIAIETELMNQADKHGRIFNAQGHQQAITAYKFCLENLHPPVEGELAEVYDDGELQDNTCEPHIDFLRDSAAIIRSKISERAKSQGVVMLHPMDKAAAPAQRVPAEAVGYLDIGAGGYIDIGSDLTDAQLSAMPKGRHMLGIIGTYGVDGYTRPQTELAQAVGGDALKQLANRAVPFLMDKEID